MKTYRDCEIQISALDADRYTLFISGPGGDARATITLPLADPVYQGLAARLESFDTDEATLFEIGQLLFRALFQGPARDVYTRSQSALGPDQGLRLRFNIDLEREPHIAALPWEFMCDPDQGPLAMLDAPIVRYLPQQAVTPTLATALPLKVLLTGAVTPPELHVQRELAEVRAALADLEHESYVQITVEEHLTRQKLMRWLREGFHIWHFIGHGGTNLAGTSATLLFEDPTGSSEAVSARELGILLNRSGLRLVVLNACNSARLTIDPFRSIAPALIRAQIPAVVAMQFTVPEEAAQAFASEFYRALAEGFPIDACVTEGRKAVMSATGLDRADWGIPVVYTRAPDGRLFDVPAPTAAPPAPPTEAVHRLPTASYGRSAGEGLSALHLLMQLDPGVLDAAVTFRTDFQIACEQIDLLGDYKDIHDQLHSLQFHCYNCIVQEARRAIDDELAWDSLIDYELTFQEILTHLQEIATHSAPEVQVTAQQHGGEPVAQPGIRRATLAAHEVVWIQDLAQAHYELQTAIETADVRKLKRAIRLVGRILMVQPSQINTRLSATVRTLRLPSLVQGLSRVRDVLSLPNLDPEKVHQFEAGLAALSDLNVKLSALVASHDRWQAIDLELRRIETTLEQDVSELELSWPDLKELVEPLCAESSAPWAAALKAEAEKLETAIAGGDAARIRQCFRRYRRLAGERFYRVDVDLKRMCDELRTIVAPLASVLRILA